MIHNTHYDYGTWNRDSQYGPPANVVHNIHTQRLVWVDLSYSLIVDDHWLVIQGEKDIFSVFFTFDTS